MCAAYPSNGVASTLPPPAPTAKCIRKPHQLTRVACVVVFPSVHGHQHRVEWKIRQPTVDGGDVPAGVSVAGQGAEPVEVSSHCVRATDRQTRCVRLICVQCGD